MNIKTLITLHLIVFIIFFTGCGKKKNKKLADNYYQIAVNHLENDQPIIQRCKLALYNLDRAIKLSSNPYYYGIKATLLLQLGKEDLAEECFVKALNGDVDPKIKGDVLNNYACLLSQQGRVMEANALWEKLKKSRHYLTPEVALFNQAKMLTRQKHFCMARNRLHEAISYAPDYVDAHYYLAVLADRYLNDHDLAKREVHTVLSLEPTHLGAGKLLKLLAAKG